MAKRGFDIIGSLVALLVLWPVMLVAALAIRLSMGAPVLFRQNRPGLRGELFELVKFRTMAMGEGSDAERMTPVGQFLRSTSIDELPELLNVLRGEMSLVGPRPLLPEYLPRYSERQSTRHAVRPGLTGLAQVNGRNATSWEERLELDATYVETRSLRGDVLILVRTVQAVLRRNGIAADGEATMAAFTRSAQAEDS